jgi:hypothetical protein
VAKHNAVFASELERARSESTIAAIFTVLETRGIHISDAQWYLIRGERDPARLSRWLVIAATCTDAASLFDD